MIIYIGFSNRSYKLFANIICNKYKHCAPVIKNKDCYEMYQFTNRHTITIIQLQKRDIKILKRYGWVFIKYKSKYVCAQKTQPITCVQFTKQFCGIHKINIQTPDGLMKYLQNKNA